MSEAVDALETAEGGAFAREIIGALEAELVRFRHRVHHDHGIELDRARAAMVLLGKLVGAGVKWVAQPDSDPARIHEAFSAIVARDDKVAPVLKREVAAFFAATADVEVGPEPDPRTPAARLRRAGADPALWWWAATYPDAASCWAACGDDTDRLVQVALAFGAPAARVVRSVAGVLELLLQRVKTRTPRPELHDAVAQLVARGKLADPGPITKLAFELMWKRDSKPDPVGEIAIHAFQLVEAVQAIKDRPDVERFGAVAARLERVQAARGLQIAALLRRDLDDAVREP
jgi:hypothetical protein